MTYAVVLATRFAAFAPWESSAWFWDFWCVLRNASVFLLLAGSAFFVERRNSVTDSGLFSTSSTPGVFLQYKCCGWSVLFLG